MAKLKIRKLIRENQILTERINQITAMLALVAHRDGGILSFGKEELKNLPEARFAILNKEDSIEMVLSYMDAMNEQVPAQAEVTS